MLVRAVLVFTLVALVANGTDANRLFRRGLGCSGTLFSEEDGNLGNPDGMCTDGPSGLASSFEEIPDRAPFKAFWDTTPYVTTKLFLFTTTCNQSYYLNTRRTVHDVSYPSLRDTDTRRLVCDCAAKTVTSYLNGVAGQPLATDVCADSSGSVTASVIYTCSMCGTPVNAKGDDDDSGSVRPGPSVLLAMGAGAFFATWF